MKPKTIYVPTIYYLNVNVILIHLYFGSGFVGEHFRLIILKAAECALASLTLRKLPVRNFC